MGGAPPGPPGPSLTLGVTDSDAGRVNCGRMADPQTPPMGHLDAIDVGAKKLTVQTEFFTRPAWRVETKVYLAGAVKKVYTADLAATPEGELQRLLDEFHRAKLDELVAGLRKLNP